MTVCYQKNKEKGLWFEIKCLEELIASMAVPEKEKVFAKKLLRSYKKYAEADHQKQPCTREKSKLGRL